MIHIAGYDIRQQPLYAKANMGVQLQHTSFQPELTVEEIIHLYPGLHGVSLNLKLPEETGTLGKQLKKVSQWSPYGVVKTIISRGMQPGHWDAAASQALLFSLIYVAVFAVTGIRKFRWAVK